MTAQNLSLPPTLPNASHLANGLALKRDPFAFFSRLAREAGDFACYTVASGETIYFVNDPALVREVLGAQEANFTKWAFNSSFRLIFGQGLNGSEGLLHRHMHRVARPALLPGRVPDYAATMLELSAAHQARWREGELDLGSAMSLLTVEIMAKTLFDVQLDDVAGDILGVGQTLQKLSDRLGSSPADDREFNAANTRLSEIARELIRRHRAAGRSDDTLLGLLLAAQSENREHRELVTDEQIVEELRTFLLAGHVTTANVLSCAFWLLSREPAVAAELRRNLDTVLGNRAPTLADLPALEICERIFLETVRLYPPVWVLGREALRDVQLGGYTVPAGAKLVIVPWTLHRDACLFPEPERFDPARWADNARSRLPRGSFIPFSAGARSCLGERFAMLEGTLLLASVAQGWSFDEIPGRPAPGWSPQAILWPRRGVWLQATRRRASAAAQAPTLMSSS